MAEPREFYYPLQDEAADIDRVLHDLVEITDTDESLDMYVKVIELEGQPHFWFGEGGEKQKPIEVDEWEVPIGDGQDWVRKSCIYAPHQTGITIEEGLSQDQINIAVSFNYNLRQYVPSGGDPPASTVNTFIRKIGVTNNYKSSTSDPMISPYYFGSITETLFNNLFNDSGSVSLSIYASVIPYSILPSTTFYLCDVVHDEDSDSYNVFLTYNERTYKIANISYESETEKVVIERFYNNNYGSSPSEQYYQRPALKFIFSFRSCNGAPFNFNLYNYYFGFAADDTPYWTQEPATIYWEVDPAMQVSSPILNDGSQFDPVNWLSTNMSVKAGIYSIGVKPEKSKIDVLYIGPLKDDLGPASAPSGNTMGITLKQGGNLAFERTMFDCQDGKVIFKGGHIDLSADGDLATGSTRAWDGTHGGKATNDMRNGEPLVVMHGNPLLQMLHESTLHLIEGASIEMDGETLLSIHDLTTIDISGAPWIHIHGTSNKYNSSHETLKYGLSVRQPSISIDDGTKLSFSGNNYGDPFVFIKGCSGIVFNNNHGVTIGDPYVSDPATDDSGPLFMVNENSFYFDGFGTKGATGNGSSFGFNIKPLDLSKGTLDKITDSTWESMKQELVVDGQCEFTNIRMSKLLEMLGRASLPYYYNHISYDSSKYIQQVGEALEDYLQTISERPDIFRKYYYIKANKYNEAMTLASEITDPIFSTTNSGFYLNGDFFGSTIVEDKFIEKGLNINDYVYAIAYEIYFGSSTLRDDFIEYYYNLYGTRTLQTESVVYRQSYREEIDDFLKYYYNQSLSDYADVSADGTMITMEWSNYLDLNAKYSEYNTNKTSSSWYITTDYSTYITIKDTFERVAEAYYTAAFPCFQERLYAGNSIIILGGNKGSKTWFKVGGESGTFTDVCITDNAKVLIQGNTEFNLSGNTQFKIEDSGITVQDGTGSINLTVEQIAELFNPQPPEWPQIDYNNMNQAYETRSSQAISCSLQNLEAGTLLVGFVSTVGAPSVGPDSSWSLLQTGTLTSDSNRNISVYTKIATAGTNSFSITTPSSYGKSLIVMIAIPEANIATIENIETQIVFTNNKAELDATTNGHRLYVYFSNDPSNGLSIPSPAPDGLNHPWIQDYSLVNLIYQYHATDEVTELTGVSATAADVSGKFDLWVLNFAEPSETTEADDVAYDNTTSGLTATNVQDALDELAQGGSSYTLPIASNSTLGGVKVGSGLVIDANGVLSLDVPTVSGVGF